MPEIADRLDPATAAALRAMVEQPNWPDSELKDFDEEAVKDLGRHTV